MFVEQAAADRGTGVREKVARFERKRTAEYLTDNGPLMLLKYSLVRRRVRQSAKCPRDPYTLMYVG